MHRIQVPKFRVGKFVLNEYEVRQLQINIAKGKHKPVTVKCLTTGNTANILANGCFDETLKQMELADNLSINLFNIINR